MDLYCPALSGYPFDTIRNTQYAIRNTQYAIRNTEYATVGDWRASFRSLLHQNVPPIANVSFIFINAHQVEHVFAYDGGRFPFDSRYGL